MGAEQSERPTTKRAATTFMLLNLVANFRIIMRTRLQHTSAFATFTSTLRLVERRSLSGPNVCSGAQTPLEAGSEKNGSALYMAVGGGPILT